MSEAKRISGAAERYARALAALAREEKAEAAVDADLAAIERALAESEELARFVKSPLFSAARQQAVFADLLRALGAHDLTRRLLAVLIRNRRLALLAELIAAWRRLRAQARGEITVEAVTAQPLNATQKKKLAAALKSALDRKVEIVNAVDPDILGGLVLRVGSRMIDASVRQRLNALKGALKGV